MSTRLNDKAYHTRELTKARERIKKAYAGEARAVASALADGLTYEEIAEPLGISRITLFRWYGKNGKGRNKS